MAGFVETKALEGSRRRKVELKHARGRRSNPIQSQDWEGGLMPLATPRQYAAMLDAAADGGYAYAAVNVTSSETLNAAQRGFKPANAAGMVQSQVGGAAYR